MNFEEFTCSKWKAYFAWCLWFLSYHMTLLPNASKTHLIDFTYM